MPQEKVPRPAPDELPAIIESLLFVAEEPQEIATLSKTLDTPRQQIESAIDALIEAAPGRGVVVQRHGTKVQLGTLPEAARYIEHFLEVDHGRLSRAALETLAVVAYRQPATRGMIEEIRGVNSDYGVATLLARGLIEESGRAPTPGRPALFSTTMRFLEYFGLQKPEDLPPLPELPGDEQTRNGSAAAEEAEAPSAEDASDGDDSEEEAEADQADVPQDEKSLSSIDH